MAAALDLPEWALGWDAEVAEDDAREAAVSDNTSLPALAIEIVKPPGGSPSREPCWSAGCGGPSGKPGLQKTEI